MFYVGFTNLVWGIKSYMEKYIVRLVKWSVNRAFNLQLNANESVLTKYPELVVNQASSLQLNAYVFRK